MFKRAFIFISNFFSSIRSQWQRDEVVRQYEETQALFEAAYEREAQRLRGHFSDLTYEQMGLVKEWKKNNGAVVFAHESGVPKKILTEFERMNPNATLVLRKPPTNGSSNLLIVYRCYKRSVLEAFLLRQWNNSII